MRRPRDQCRAGRVRQAWRARRLLGAAIAVAALAGFTGCDLQENADLDKGEQLFTQKCGTCHALTGAGTSATVGPNLDAAFAQARASGMDQDTIEGVVESQIENPRPANPDQTDVYMPANLVEGDDLKNVAAYVAKCAGADPKNEQDRLACPDIVAKPGGEGLYASLGCQGCHSIDGSASSGPTFKGLFNSMVTLTSRQKVKADEKYLLESILDPDHQVVQGYQPGVMSAVVPKGSVPPDQAQELVDYIKTLR